MKLVWVASLASAVACATVENPKPTEILREKNIVPAEKKKPNKPDMG